MPDYITPAVGYAHEIFVRQELASRGWDIHYFGIEHRGSLSKLLSGLRTPLRMFPDYFGVKMSTQDVFGIAHPVGHALFDAKSTYRKDTPNYAIEAWAVEVGIAFEAMGEPTIYVWEEDILGGVRASRASEVNRLASQVLTKTDVGSGDPYRLIPKEITRTLDVVLEELLLTEAAA